MEDYDLTLNVNVTNPIQRQECDLTEAEFIEKYVRTGTPVILQNCQGYEWIQKYDFTIEKLAKVFVNKLDFNEMSDRFFVADLL